MISDAIEGILGFIFRIILEIVCFYTGEIFLSLITFGHKRPRWDYYSNSSVTKWMIMTEFSTWVGGAFWVITIGYTVRLIAQA